MLFCQDKLTSELFSLSLFIIIFFFLILLSDVHFAVITWTVSFINELLINLIFNSETKVSHHQSEQKQGEKKKETFYKAEKNDVSKLLLLSAKTL